MFTLDTPTENPRGFDPPFSLEQIDENNVLHQLLGLSTAVPIHPTQSGAE